MNMNGGLIEKNYDTSCMQLKEEANLMNKLFTHLQS